MVINDALSRQRGTADGRRLQRRSPLGIKGGTLLATVKGTGRVTSGSGRRGPARGPAKGGAGGGAWSN